MCTFWKWTHPCRTCVFVCITFVGRWRGTVHVVLFLPCRRHSGMCNVLHATVGILSVVVHVDYVMLVCSSSHKPWFFFQRQMASGFTCTYFLYSVREIYSSHLPYIKIGTMHLQTLHLSPHVSHIQTGCNYQGCECTSVMHLLLFLCSCRCSSLCSSYYTCTTTRIASPPCFDPVLAHVGGRFPNFTHRFPVSQYARFGNSRTHLDVGAIGPHFDSSQCYLHYCRSLYWCCRLPGKRLMALRSSRWSRHYHF